MSNYADNDNRLATLANPMDRPHITQPEDLMELAASGFIQFNLRNEKDEYIEKFYVYEFVAAARELGYEDIEHTEALVILEAAKSRAEDAYRSDVRSAIEHQVNREWLETFPHIDTFDEFIAAFNKGQFTLELAEAFSDIVGDIVVRPGGDQIYKIYDELFENDFHRKIHAVIRGVAGQARMATVSIDERMQHGPETLSEALEPLMMNYAERHRRAFDNSEPPALLMNALAALGMRLVELTTEQIHELSETEASIERQYSLIEDETGRYGEGNE